MISAPLEGLQKEQDKEHVYEHLWDVCVFSKYELVEVGTRNPRRLPLPHNRKEMTLPFVALIRTKAFQHESGGHWEVGEGRGRPNNKQTLLLSLWPLFFVCLKHTTKCLPFSKLH